MAPARTALATLCFALAAANLGCPPPPPSRPAEPPPPAPPRLLVCAPETETSWYRGWSAHAGWVLGELEGELSFSRATASAEACRADAGKAWSGLGCYGRPGVVSCDGTTLARIAAVAALLAPVTLRWAAGAGPRPSARLARVTVEAVEADARDASAGVKNREERFPVVGGWFMQEHKLDQAGMDRVLESLSWVQASVPPLREALEVRQTYRSIVLLVLGFIVGHEMAHAREHCSDPPSAASRARVDTLAAAQQQGSGVCAAPVDLDEMAADACALGVVERLRGTARPSQVEAASRQMAVDVVSVLAEFGLGDALRHPGVQPQWGGSPVLTLDTSEVRARPGYLYPQARLALLASALEGRDAQLCGETGWAFANLALAAARRCGAKPAMPEGAPWVRFVSAPLARFLRDPRAFATFEADGTVEPSSLHDLDVSCAPLR